ncbi:MAG: hypothetical protein M3P06_09185 [Acidobacteriota bacterium]|nr:hypothetical protein [Acidobacteriota bacterium]
MRYTPFIGIVQVLLLLGVVASLGWPGIWIQRMEKKERVTREAMSRIHRTVLTYGDAHQGALPAAGELARLPARDGWGFPLLYRSWREPEGGGYILISTGADGKLDANSRALLGIVEAPAPSRAVTSFLARPVSAPRTWAEAFDDDTITVSADLVFDHPPRRMNLKDAPPVVLRQGAISASVFGALFLLVTIRHYRRSHAS